MCLDVFAHPLGIVIELRGDLLQSTRNPFHRTTGGHRCRTTEATQESQNIAGVLAQGAVILRCRTRPHRHSVEETVAGPAFYQDQRRQVTQTNRVQVLLESGEEFGFGDLGDVIEVALHQRHVGREIVGGQQPDSWRFLQLLVYSEQLS